MKTLTFVRPTEPFNGRCSYTILAGDQVVAELANGESATVPLPPELEGSTLRARHHWVGSVEVPVSDLPDGGRVQVSGSELLNRKLPLAGAMMPLTMLALLGAGNGVFKAGGTAVLVVLLLGLVGTLTVWRDRWLRLEVEPEAVRVRAETHASV